MKKFDRNNAFWRKLRERVARKSTSLLWKDTTTMAFHFFPGKMVIKVRPAYKGEVADRDAVFFTWTIKWPSTTPHLRFAKSGPKYTQKVLTEKVLFCPHSYGKIHQKKVRFSRL